MDLIICPNGHPNRPGRPQCVVCKAALPMPPDTEPPLVESPSAVAGPAPTPATPPATTESAPTPTAGDTLTRSGNSRWRALLLILLLILAVGATWLLWPRLRDDTTTQLVPPAATDEPALVIVAPTDPPPTAPIATIPPATDQAVVAPLPPDPATTQPAVTEPAATEPAATEPVATEPPPLNPSPTIDPAGSELLTHGNLIANGDFSADWGDTWLRQVSDNNGVQSIEVIALDAAPAATGLRLTKTGTGTTRLQQIINVPRRATELRFTGALRLVGSATPDSAEGRVALMLTYLDENDAALGYSVWIDGSQPASTLWGRAPLPAFGPQLSPRYALDEGWQTIDIRLQEEFLNRLPGLAADRVRRVGVDLLALASETCEPAGCPVTLEAADLQLLPTAME